jgi:hypothetical protein
MDILQSKSDMPIVVHVYILKGYEVDVQASRWHSKSQAITYAQKQFKHINVYKVKVWDTERGPIIPNRWDAPGLVFELV